MRKIRLFLFSLSLVMTAHNTSAFADYYCSGKCECGGDAFVMLEGDQTSTLELAALNLKTKCNMTARVVNAASEFGQITSPKCFPVAASVEKVITQKDYNNLKKQVDTLTQTLALKEKSLKVCSYQKTLILQEVATGSSVSDTKALKVILRTIEKDLNQAPTATAPK